MSKDNSITLFFSRLLLLLLFVPMLQTFFGFCEAKELKGLTDKVENPVWSQEDWFAGDYQKTKEQYSKENFGLREQAVRLDNDLNYSFFNQSNAKDAVLGKENFVFEKIYINEYYGKDFIGKDGIVEKVENLKEIQSLFKSMGKTFLFIVAPSKARFYSEYLPEGYLQKDSTNYDWFKKESKERGLEFFDVNAWFESMKGTMKHPLFPQGGTHWSHYGVTFFVDSLLTLMEQKIGKDLPELLIDSTWVSDSLLFPDNDLNEVLNLSTELPSGPHAYAKCSYRTKWKYRPNVLAIGDSFWGTYYFSEFIPQTCFNASSYWYYFHTIHPEGRARTEKDLLKLKKQDVVILIATTANLKHIGWGALGTLKDYLGQPEEMLIQNIIEEIKASPQWFIGVENKALEQGIPLDTMLHRDAVFIMNQRKNKL